MKKNPGFIKTGAEGKFFLFLLNAGSKCNIFSILLTVIVLLCNDLTIEAQIAVVGNSGSSQSAVKLCAPASYNITYRFEFITPANPTANNSVSFRVIDNDDNSVISQQDFTNISVQTGAAPFFRKYVEQSATITLPEPGDCEYSVVMYFYYEGTLVNSATQIQYVGNWHVDDEAGGEIAIDPLIERVCEGYGLSNFTFQDASNFACVIPALHNPNIVERYVQFVYGTTFDASQSIPNLYINDGTKDIQITDATGAPVIPLPYYGPVISTGPAPLGGSQISYPISFSGAGAVVDDYFEVLIRNWNYCNPWNGDQDNPNAVDAKTATARIVIIDSPDPPAITDKEICFGGDRELEITSAPTGEFKWYSDALMTTLVTSGVSTYTPSQDAPGVYSYWVTDAALPSGNGCESAPAKVTLTIYDAISNNTVSAPQTICYNTSPAPLTGTVPSGGNLTYSYLWESSTTSASSGFSVATGSNTLKDYTPSALTTSTWFRRTVTSGPCTHVSDAILISVLAVPTATISGATTLCKDATSPDVKFSNPQPYPVTVTYNINGGADKTVDIGSGTSATVAAPTGTTGIFDYNLVSVSYQLLPACSANITGKATITVTPTVGVPSALSPSDITICQGSVSTVFTTSATNATSYIWSVTGAGNTVSGTGTTGTVTWSSAFSGVATVSVRANGCNGPSASVSTTVAVRPAPSPAISGSVSVCKDAASPAVTFTNPYNDGITITYNIKAGVNKAIIVPANATASVAAPTDVVGVFDYNLVSAVYQTAPGCTNALSGKVTVTVNPSAPAAAGPITGPTDICDGQSGVTYSITAVANASDYVWNVPCGIITSGNNTNSITVDFTSGAVSPCLISVYPKNGCGAGTSSSVSINITPKVSLLALSPLTPVICQGSGSTSFTANAANATSYSWSVTGTGNSILGTGNTATATWDNGFSGTSTVKVIAYGCNGSSESASTVVTVRPTPTATISGSEVVCEGGSASAIVFTNPQAYPVSITYNINGGSGNTISVGASSSASVIVSTSAEGSFEYNLESVAYQTAPLCSNAVAGSATVIVRPVPTATVNGTIQVCKDDPFPDITFENPLDQDIMVTYNINGGSSKAIEVSANTSATVSVSTVAEGEFKYNMTGVSYKTSPGCTNSVTGTATVTVSPSVTTPVFAMGAASVRCQSAGTVTYDATANNTTGITYTLDGTSIAGGNTINSATGEVTYSADWSGTSVITASAAGCNGPETAKHTVNTLAAPATPALDGTTSVCGTGKTTFFYRIGDGSYLIPGNEYHWTVPAEAVKEAGGETGDNFIVLSYPATGHFTISLVENTTYPIVCTGPVQNIDIDVYSNPVANAGAEVTICQDEATILGGTPAATGGTGDYSYSWLPEYGLDDPSAEHPVAAPAFTITYQLIVTDNKSGCTVAVPSPVKVKVNPKPVIYSSPTSQIACEGTVVIFSATASGDEYHWQASTDGGKSFNDVNDNEIYDNISSTSLTINNVTSSMNGYLYRMRAEGSKSCAAINTSNALLTVNIAPAIITQPVSTEVCEGSFVSLVSEAVGAVTYQWFISIDGGTTFTPVSNDANYFGAATNTLSILNVPAGFNGYQYKVAASGTCNPPAESITATLTVNTKAGIAKDPENVTLCEGGTAVFNVFTSGTGPFTYQWYRNGTPISDGGNFSGTNASVLSISNVLKADEAVYHVMITGKCGSVKSKDANLYVSNVPEIESNPTDVTVCEGSVVSFKVTTDMATGIAYQWQESKDNGVTWNDIADSGLYLDVTTAEMKINGAKSTMTGYHYRVRINSSCTAGDIFSADALLTVNASPSLTDAPVNVVSCEGLSAGFFVTGGGAGLKYQWQVNSGSGFIDIHDDGVIYSGTNTDRLTISNLTLSMNGYLVRVILSGICLPPVTSSYAKLTVYSQPYFITQPDDQEICESSPVVFRSQINNTGGGETVNWQVDEGSGWKDLVDNTVYQGTQTSKLQIIRAMAGMSGWKYRMKVSGPCNLYYSDPALLTVNKVPDALISDKDTILICGDVSFQLHGNPSGGSGDYVNHRWIGDIGPLSKYGIENPAFYTSLAGYYDLAYQVIDSKGCYAADSIVIQVEKPVAMFTADALSGCQPLTVNFTNASTDYASLLWDFGDSTTSVSVNPSHTYLNQSLSVRYRTVKLSLTSANGCEASIQNNIIIYPQITSDFSFGDDTICSGETAIMTSMPGGAFRYYWKFGDGTEEYGANIITHRFVNNTLLPVTYNVVLTTTSFFGCTSRTTRPVVVYPTPVAEFVASPVSQSYPNTTVNFTNRTNDGAWDWLWKFGDGNVSSLGSPVHSYTDPGTYSVYLRADNKICSDSVKHSITILPVAPVADFDSIPSGCKVWTISPENTSLYATSYHWDFGDGSTSTVKDPVYSYTQDGLFKVTLTITGPGGTHSKSQLVHVYPSPLAYFEISPTTVYVNDESIRCYNLTQNAVSYIWEFGDGDTSHVFEPYHRYVTEGVYDVTLHAFSANGCDDTFVQPLAVSVIPFGDLSFANVFRPNQTGEIVLDELPTGGDEVNQFFYPSIRETVEEYHLQIYNRWGTLIYEAFDINKPWNGYYQHSLCPQGVYVWIVEGKYANGRPFKKVGDITLLH